MIHPGNDKSYKGKPFVIALFVGFVVFAAVCGFGTYGLAQVFTPGLRERSEAAVKKAQAEKPLQNPTEQR